MSLEPIALDVSLEKARALHRVWRALNDGDCPRCHTFQPATEMLRSHRDLLGREIMDGVMCPACGFAVTTEEITAIETLFAPAMDAAVAIFEAWRRNRNPEPFVPSCACCVEGGMAWQARTTDCRCECHH